MIGTLIQLLLALIVIGVLIWGLQRILAVLPVAEPYKTIAYVVIVVISVLIAVYFIAQLFHIAIPRLAL